MNRPQCSLVFATYERGHLLERSLECYRRQDFPLEALELVVIDDHSTDHTRRLVMDWAGDLGVSYQIITCGPKQENWRDAGAILNYGMRAALGHFVLLTHPEVMPGRSSLSALVKKLEDYECRRAGNSPPESASIGLYASCKVYYLSPREQEMIDTVDWKTRGNLAVRDIPGFYGLDSNGNPDYTHETTDRVATPGFRLQTWDSWVFGGCSRETWRRFGGMWTTRKWGSIDIAFRNRRKQLGMAEWTSPDERSIVIHQNHDGERDVKTPRIHEAWEEELASIDTDKLAYPDVNELEW